MSEPYVPKVNDYVIWDKGEYGSDEGWVYFFCDEYITIETSVRPKPKETLDCKSSNHHKMIHTLLLCNKECWHELEYVKNRRDQASLDMYKSQDGRHPDY